MTKTEFLDRLREGIRTEESATSVYLGHLNTLVLRSGFPPERLEQVRGIIQGLIAANRTHRRRLEGIVARVEGEAADVF